MKKKMATKYKHDHHKAHGDAKGPMGPQAMEEAMDARMGIKQSPAEEMADKKQGY